ncbi:retrovirus-related pol polyprotein from transposon TNT 1-94 [Tanacetum coccineum]
MSEPSYKSPVNNYSSVSKGFQPKFTPKLIQSSSNSNNQANPKFQKYYKAEYRKMKSKIALLEAKVSDEEEVTQVKVLMALADDELIVGKSHARNGNSISHHHEKFVEEQRLEHTVLSITKEQLKEEKKINEKWLTSLKKVSQCINEQIPHQKKKVHGGKLLTGSSSKMNENENLFVPASMRYDQEMVPKTKDWVERLNPVSKHPNFNTGRILVPKSQAVNESLETSNTLESSKDSEAEFLTPLPPLKILQGASPSSEVIPLTFQPHSLKERPGLGIMKHTKPETQDSSNKSVLGTVTVSESKQTTSSVPTEVKDTKQESKLNELTKLILRAKAKPFLPCTHGSFNDHIPDDCRNYLECEIYRSYVHSTSALYTPPLTTMSLITSKERHIKEPIWYLDSRCSRSMTGVKSYLHKYVEQPGPKIVFGDNSSCITEGYGSINCEGIFDDKQGRIFNANKESVLVAPRRNDVYVLDMSLLTPNGACFFVKASESVNWLWHKRLSHLNFKNINKLSKQNKVLGIPSLVYSKDKPCTACEKGKHHRASFKTKQNFFIKKCLHLLHMDLFGPVSPMSINHEKYTLFIVDEYSRTKFRNHELESFCDEKGISQNFSSPYTPEQNGVAERRNKTLIEATRTMLNGSVLSKHFWTDAVRIACYTQNISIIVKRHDKTSYEIFMERIPDISYFHVFRCPVFIHNHKDHLGIFDAKADDGYFLGYSSVSKAFRVYNTRRQQIYETYHVTFDESMEAIRFTNTLVDEIGIDDSSRYPPDEFQKDVPSRQYQVDSDVSYYIIPHGCLLTEITQENHVPKVIAPNEPEIPYTEDDEGPPDQINTEGTHEQYVQNDQMITQPTDVSSGNNIEVSGSITEPLVPDVTQSHITNQASTSSHHIPQDRWSRDQYIELVNIIGDPGEGMLTRSMAAKLITASASECLFADFLFVIEPKKVPNGYSGTRKMSMAQQQRTKQDWLHKGIVKNNELTMMKPLHHPICKISVQSKGITSNICEKNPQNKHLRCLPNTWWKLVCWSAKKQQSVAMSSTEAEYVAAIGCYASILWIKSQLSDYDIHYKMDITSSGITSLKEI